MYFFLQILFWLGRQTLLFCSVFFPSKPCISRQIFMFLSRNLSIKKSRSFDDFFRSLTIDSKLRKALMMTKSLGVSSRIKKDCENSMYLFSSTVPFERHPRQLWSPKGAQKVDLDWLFGCQKISISVEKVASKNVASKGSFSVDSFFSKVTDNEFKRLVTLFFLAWALIFTLYSLSETVYRAQKAFFERVYYQRKIEMFERVNYETHSL